jgi:hypothetical protein
MSEQTTIITEAQILKPVEGQLIKEEPDGCEEEECQCECECEECEKSKEIEKIKRLQLIHKMKMFMRVFSDELTTFQPYMNDINNMSLIDLTFVVQDAEYTINTLSRWTVFKRFLYMSFFGK